MELTPVERGFVRGMVIVAFAYVTFVAGVLLPVVWTWAHHTIRALQALS